MSDSECTFSSSDMNFFAKINQMYNQVEKNVDIGKILAANIEEPRMKSYYRHCRCEEMNAGTLTKLCRAISVIHLMENNEAKTFKRKRKFGSTIPLTLRGNSYHVR